MEKLKSSTLRKPVRTERVRDTVIKLSALADVAREYVRNNPDYKLYSFDDSVSICFNYKNIDPTLLCTALYEHQITVVGFGSFKEDTFIRLVTINANNSEKEILNFFKVMEEFVEKNPSLVSLEEETILN